MGGESLDSVQIDRRGLDGDRWFAVVDDEGKLASGKTTRRFRRRDAVFDHRAATTDAGVEVTNDAGTWRVGDAALDEVLSDRMGARVRVASEQRTSHFDDGAVSLVGTATVDWFKREWGVDADPRRLRANLVITTDEPFAEERWMGRTMTIGSVDLTVTDRVPRCRMIDLAQDGVTAGRRWLTRLALEREMCAAVYLDVRRPGTLSVGDAVTVD